MEQKILGIIKNHFYNVTGTPEKSAKEIAELFKEFIEWVGIMQDEIWYNKFHGNWSWIISTETSENISHYTLDKLFDYWIKNVKQK